MGFSFGIYDLVEQKSRYFLLKFSYACYLLSMRWFSLEEERVMQQSSVIISLSFENKGINPVADNAQVT